MPSSAVQFTNAPAADASRLNEATIALPLLNSSICLPPLPRAAEAIVPELIDVRSRTSVGVMPVPTLMPLMMPLVSNEVSAPALSSSSALALEP